MDSDQEQLTREQHRDAGPNVEDFLHVVLRARRLRDRDGGAGATALHKAYEVRWRDASYRRGFLAGSGNLIDEVSERALVEMEEAERHGRGTVAFLLDEVEEISGAALDAALAVLVRDLLDDEDFELLTATWREFGLPLGLDDRLAEHRQPASVRTSSRLTLRPEDVRPVVGQRYVRIQDGVEVRVTELTDHQGNSFVGIKVPGTEGDWVRAADWPLLYRPTGPRSEVPASSSS